MGPVRAVVVGALVWTSGGCRQLFGLDPPIVAADAPVVDAPIDTAITCYGTGLVTYCPQLTPTQSVVLSGTLDTDGDPRCVIDKGNCVIAGASIAIDATFRAEGARPIVLVAVTTIDITATLDVGSHREFIGFAPVDHVGAGEGSGTCGSATPATNDASVGAGGGAGGSFGGRGGGGGAGGSGAPGGTSAATIAPGVFRGGCPGSRGGDAGSVKGGIGAHGGGAVYLIAGTQITVSATGAINAGGEGGYPGTSMSGGGGAGSGGFIGLDAPSVMNAGAIYANGGGGGEGGGASAPGDYGASSQSPDQAAGGGNINANAGNGGAGSFKTMLDGGAGGVDTYAGGGGGGGAGIIQLFQASSVAGIVMPPPIF